MVGADDQGHRAGLGIPSHRWTGYAIALVATGLALAVAGLLLFWSSTVSYSPLIGAVALSVWFGGLGPGLLSIAVGWLCAWALLEEPRGSFDLQEADSVARLLVPFVVSLLIVWLAWVMRIGRERAAERAETAERSRSTTEALQDLASALSSAVTPPDVAHALVERVPAMLGAMGASLGLVDGEELHVVDPQGSGPQMLTPGLRLRLSTRAPITEAARRNAPAFAATREEFERSYPDGARLAPTAAGALAVPLASGSRVLGSMGMPFASPHAIDEETIALARIAAELGGQALERADVFDQERLSREGLDRVVRLAPRFAGESPETVVAAICEEARETLGADIAQVWSSVSPDVFEVMWRDPPHELIPPGTLIEFADFPGLREAMDRFETMFMPDSQQGVTGLALKHAKAVGVHSSLRVPIVIGGTAGRILVLQWQRVISPPQPATLVLARRFADQAGLALAQAERRVAQEAAAQNAEEARRLLDITAALAAALTPKDVADAALSEAVRALRADAGVVVRLSEGGDELELIEAIGYPEAAVRQWQRFDVEASVPVADAVRRNEIVALESPEERQRRYPVLASTTTRHAAWLSVPLTAGGRVVGALGLSFVAPRTFGDADREFGFALARQAGQALERASLHEAEHEARARAELMAGDLAQLHVLSTQLARAATAVEVAELVSSQISAVIGAEAAGIYVVSDAGSLELLDTVGAWRAQLVGAYRRLEADTAMPVSEAVRGGAALWLMPGDDWSRFPDSEAWRADGLGALGVVPLAVEDRAIGALFVLFAGDREVQADHRRFVETVARQAAQPLERVRLLEREMAFRRAAERATERVRRLYAVTAALSQAGTARQVGMAFLQTAVEAIGAARGAVMRVADGDGSEVEMIASLGYAPAEIEPWQRFSVEVDIPATVAIRSGEPVWAATADDVARFRDGRTAAQVAGDSAFAAVPLIGASGTQGAVVLSFDEPREIGADDRELLAALASQCAQALDRSRLYDDERVLRRRSDRLQAFTAALSGSLTPDEVATVFLEQAYAAVAADGAAIGVVDSDGRVIHTIGWRGYSDETVAPWRTFPVGADFPLAQVFRRSRAIYAGADAIHARYPALAGELGGTGHRSFAFTPLVAAGRPLGVAVFSWERAVEPSAEERTFLETLASQCGQALDRARRYETERTIAETLQRSVLPETLPSMEGVQVAARYLPGTAAMDVGGDWFDTIPLHDGRLAFVVGDVVGKGVTAASTMAQLRNGLRALALDSSSDATTVTKLNRLLEGYTDAPFATLAYLTVDPQLRSASVISAGHLPPLVVSVAGEVSFLESGRGLPLGVDADSVYEPWHGVLEPGSLVVLYTDGLVERRDQSLDAGLDWLARSAARAPHEPEQFVDAVLADLIGGGERGDDIALLAVRLDPTPLETLELRLPSDRSSLQAMREALQAWLARAAIPEVDARDIVLATWEAGANAIEHPADPSELLVDVRVSLTGDRVRIEVTDSGRWTQPEPRADRGLGLRLMQSLMSAMDIEQGGDGTRVVMERTLSRERVGDRAGPAEG